MWVSGMHIGLPGIVLVIAAVPDLAVALITSSVVVALMIFTAVKLMRGSKRYNAEDFSDEDPNARLLRVGFSIFLWVLSIGLLVCDLEAVTGSGSVEGIWEPLRITTLAESLAVVVLSRLNKRKIK
jgi:hypothetical protein